MRLDLQTAVIPGGAARCFKNMFLSIVTLLGRRPFGNGSPQLKLCLHCHAVVLIWASLMILRSATRSCCIIVPRSDSGGTRWSLRTIDEHTNDEAINDEPWDVVARNCGPGDGRPAECGSSGSRSSHRAAPSASDQRALFHRRLGEGDLSDRIPHLGQSLGWVLPRAQPGSSHSLRLRRSPQTFAGPEPQFHTPVVRDRSA